jgi:hypothetical protein
MQVGNASAPLTVLLAVLVYVLGQLIQRFIIDPITEQRKTIGEIANSLLYLGNISGVAYAKANNLPIGYPEEPEKASSTLRLLAGRLRASLWTIPFYSLWSALRFFPSRNDVLMASRSLVGWSNSLYTGDPAVHVKRVIATLRLPDPDD